MPQFDHDSGAVAPILDACPKRYVVASSGERALIGLSVEETREFEMAAEGASTDAQRARKRWFALYAKHERGWQRLICRSNRHLNHR